jgi:hypothetical protein
VATATSRSSVDARRIEAEEDRRVLPVRRLIPLVLLVAVVAAIFLMLRKPAREARPADPIDWIVRPPADAPTGEALRVSRAPSPPVVRWKGTYAFEQTTSGDVGHERTVPNRAVSGTFTAIETNSRRDGAEDASVAATFEVAETVQSAASTPRQIGAKLSFSRGADGAVVHRSIKLEAAAGLAGELEVFQLAFTQRFGVPDRPVRVGERLPIEDCVDVDDALLRPQWFLFRERAAKGDSVAAPIEGGVWIASRDGAADGTLTLQAALSQAHTGVTGPDGPDAVRIDYRAVLDGARTLGLADALPRRHALSLSRRIHYSSRDLDYAVVVRARLEMAQDSASK